MSFISSVDNGSYLIPKLIPKGTQIEEYHLIPKDTQIQDPDLYDAALEHDKYDEKLFERTINLDNKIANQIRLDANVKNTSRLFDIFSSFYKMFPKVKNDMQLTNQGKFIKEVMETQEYQDLRASTTLDDFASALASFKFFEATKEEKPNKQNSKPANMSAQDQKFVDEFEKGMDSEAEARYRIRKALKETKEEIEKVNLALTGAGQEKGSLGQTDAKKAMELYNKIKDNKTMMKIAELAGKMSFVAKKAQKEKIVRNTGSVVGVEIGNELQRLLPIEILRIVKPKLKKIFYRDMLEGKLQQYSMEDEESLGKGPIVCCIDCSGSMSGQRHIWAKAVAMSLFQIAKEEKRAFAVFSFTTKVELVFEYLFHDQELLADLAKLDSGGGTFFTYPISRSIDFILERDKFKTADIVFITDGDCDHSKDTCEVLKNKRKENGINMYSFLIGSHKHKDIQTLEWLSDQVFSIDDLTEKAEGLETIFTI